MRAAPRAGAVTAGSTAERSGGRAARYGWLVPRVVLPMFDRARGGRVGARLKELREGQWRSSDELEGVAVERLRRLLGHAAAHVPYYRRLLADAGLQPRDVRTLADLAKLPTTSRAALAGAGLEETTADNLPPSRRWAMATSGSTGVPLQFHADLAAEDTRLATYLLGLEWAGLAVHDAEVRIVNPFLDFPHYPRPGVLARLGSRILLGQRTYRLKGPRPGIADLQRLVRDAAAGGRSWFFWSLPSVLAILGDQLLRAGTELPAVPKVIVSRGETLTAIRRTSIETAFRGPVVDHYACNEVAHVAQSCPAGSGLLHVLGDRLIVSVVREDGRRAEPGESGRVLLTDLENEVMPLINYAVGDRATIGSPCACGRGLPVLARVDGRESEAIWLPNGDRISAFMIESYLRVRCDITPLREYQAVQTALDRLRLRVVVTPRFTHRAADRLRQGLEDLLGPGMAVDIEEVDEIASEPSGKRPTVKSEVPA